MNSAVAPFAAPGTGRRRRARTGEWEAAYFDALSRGHTKAAAAKLAGVRERSVYKRASHDLDFAEQESIAYHLGTGVLLDIALDRVTDPVRPGDNVLIHLLSARGVSSRRCEECSEKL